MDCARLSLYPGSRVFILKASVAFGHEKRGLMEAIRLLVSDVDGVMNQGILYFGTDGQECMKAFHVKDGMGIRRWLDAGNQFAVISGRGSPILKGRLEALGVRHLFENTEDKLECLKKLLSDLGMSAEHVAYIGDDVNDLQIIEWLRSQGGATFCPADAVGNIQEASGSVLSLKGGEGCLRECIDRIMGHNRS